MFLSSLILHEDDLLGSKHSKQFKTILDDLAWNTKRLGRYHKEFEEAVMEHPDTNFRMEVFSRVCEYRLQLLFFVNRQISTLLASSTVANLKEWFDPSTKANAAKVLAALHYGSLRDTDVCRTTLQHINAFREMWGDIAAWLANYQFEESWYVPWPRSVDDGSAKTKAMDVRTAAQRIVVLMNDHEKTLQELYTFWGRFLTFRDVATKDVASKPSESGKDLHYIWGQLSRRMSSLSVKLGVISLEITSCGPPLDGPFRDSA